MTNATNSTAFNSLPEGINVENKSKTGDESVSFHDSEKGVKLGSSATDTDEVYDDDWDNDPENARNWSRKRKWVAVAVVAFYSFIAPLSSSMMAPGLPQVATQYHITSPTIVGMTLSIFLISFGIGPLILSPLSELYGRTWILHICNIFTLAFNLGCAFAPNTGSLLALRLLAGFFASAPPSIGGGTISDLFNEEERASAMAIFSMGPLLGPSLGPVAAGFTIQELGLKWVFILLGISSGATALIGIPFLKETYAPVLRLRKAAKAANPDLARRTVIQTLGIPDGSRAEVIWSNLTRPIALLFGNLICFALSLYMAFTFGINFLMFATFARLFRDIYGFSPGIAGLTYLGLGLGFFAAAIIGAKFSDRMYQMLAKRNGGKGTPEMRMPSLFIACLIVPVGVLWYGWSAHAKLHWIMPLIGTFIFGFGIMTAFLPILLYLVDAFKYGASAVGAANLFRSIFGFAFPLFGQQMNDGLGVGPANTLLAGLAIVIGIPFSLWIYYRGGAVRERSNVAR